MRTGKNGRSHAIDETGVDAGGRRSTASSAVPGLAPADLRVGHAGASIRFAVGASSLGAILVAVTGRGVCAILLGDEPASLVRDLQEAFPRADLAGGDRGVQQLVSRAAGLVETPGRDLDLPLDVRGTPFQHRVWQALREIPAGSTTSYTAVAERIGTPRGARAVARACASNVVAVVIPCHRVVRADGGLAGYRWGLERKRALLAREAAS